MNQFSKDYLAGFFDGEGSIGIYKAQTNSYILRIQLTQNFTSLSVVILNQLNKQYGGSISKQKSLSGNVKLNWQINSYKASVFLEDMIPFLFLKKEEAEVALQYQILKPKLIRNARGHLKRESPCIGKEYSDKLKSLKRNYTKWEAA